ncbi:MAG: cytochrome c [Paracoccaceae bacterium]|nr:cytochrome c [Paracoccaceae bacterium]
MISAALAVLATAGAAIGEETGEEEYLSACASCHGVGGTGPGPMKDYLSVAPPGLTGLAAANDGAFPMLKVIQIIDGRTGVRGHGGDGMPVWGAVFKAAEREAGSYAAEIEARGRMLSLALYLEAIQE